MGSFKEHDLSLGPARTRIPHAFAITSGPYRRRFLTVGSDAPSEHLICGCGHELRIEEWNGIVAQLPMKLICRRCRRPLILRQECFISPNLQTRLGILAARKMALDKMEQAVEQRLGMTIKEAVASLEESHAKAAKDP